MNTNPALPSAGRRVPDWWLFFNKFLRQGTEIAALAPSSRWLAQAAVRGIDFARARCIVELGAGTGPITRQLTRQVRDDCRLLVIEREPDFCARLKAKFPGVEIVEADANDLERLLAERNIDKVDHVLSGLPLPSFPPEMRARLLEVIHRCLASEGTFRQLTHMPWVFHKMYRRSFAEVRFRLVTRNLPPGGVYVCRGAVERCPAGRG